MGDEGSTEKFTLPTAEGNADAMCLRIGLCLLACQGIDTSTLELLAARSNTGRTNLQDLVDRVSWTGLRVKR